MWPQLSLCLGSDTNSGTPHGTYASISVITEVLVSPGEREAGGCSKGSQPQSCPCPKVKVHHMGYGIVVGRRERFIHPPQDNTKVYKVVTASSHLNPSPPRVLCLKQVLAAHEYGTERSSERMDGKRGEQIQMPQLW